MKCKKCGAEIEAGDAFCGNCGEKADTENTSSVEAGTYDEVETVDNTEKKPKKKTKLIIGIAIAAIVVIAAVALFASQPDEMDIEAGELAEVLLSEDEDAIKDYEGVTLHVHGYLNRDSDKDYYLLYTNAKDDVGVMFTSKEPLDEEVGNESELVVTGEIVPMEEGSSLWVLEAETIDVRKQAERIYSVESVSRLLKNSEKYLNKKVMLSGAVLVAGSDAAMVDVGHEYEDKYVRLIGLSETKTAKVGSKYGMYMVTGTYYMEGSDPAVDVEKIELVSELDVPEEMQESDSVIEVDSPKELIDSYQKYDGKTVAVTGWIEAAGDSGYLMGGDEPIELTNLTPQDIMELYGGYTKFTGEFTRNGGIYYLHVEKMGE